ncbi:MAG: hypothetical protein EU550_00230, partial [Promethearchaeota archaeon]
MDKNVKEFYILFVFYIIIILLLHIPSLFISYSSVPPTNIIFLIAANYTYLLFGSLEAIPFFIISIVQIKKNKIKKGIFTLEIGTLLNSFNIFFIFIIMWMSSQYPSDPDAKYHGAFNIFIYLFVIHSILLVIFTFVLFIENKRKNFQKIISKYKKERNKAKLEKIKRKEYLRNLFIDKKLLKDLKSKENMMSKEDFLNILEEKRNNI